jgi:hypothetical protein
MANPYAPPGFDDGGFVPPGGGGVAGTPQPWEVGEVLKLSWEIIKRQPILVVVVFGVYLITNLPGSVGNLLAAVGLLDPASTELLVVTLGGTFIGGVLGVFLQIGQLKMFVAAARGQQADFGLLLSGADRFFPLIAMSIVMLFAIFIGLLALCVGAVIVSLGLMLAQYYLIDAKQGVIESLKTSWEVTKGNRLNLLVYLLVCFGLMIVGICAFCVGMFVAMAIFMAGLAVIYLRSAGETVTGGAPPEPTPHPYAPQYKRRRVFRSAVLPRAHGFVAPTRLRCASACLPQIRAKRLRGRRLAAGFATAPLAWPPALLGRHVARKHDRRYRQRRDQPVVVYRPQPLVEVTAEAAHDELWDRVDGGGEGIVGGAVIGVAAAHDEDHLGCGGQAAA